MLSKNELNIRGFWSIILLMIRLWILCNVLLLRMILILPRFVLYCLKFIVLERGKTYGFEYTN